MTQTHEDPIQSAHEWLEEAARHLGLDPQEATALTREIPVSYTHLTLPTNREV